ncbi:MAG: VPLPA-CTERM sorting domain-containing protein, partial [Pseudomonadota bacterium]
EYSGSLDVSGLSFAQGRTQVSLSLIRPDRSFYFNMFDYLGYFDASVSVTGPGAAGPLSLGASSASFTHTRYGDQFGYGVTSGASRGGAVYTAFDYVNGSEISGGSTTLDTALADLGVTGPATVVFGWSTDNITHYYGTRPPPVPLPASLGLLATGLAGFAWLRRRKG